MIALSLVWLSVELSIVHLLVCEEEAAVSVEVELWSCQPARHRHDRHGRWLQKNTWQGLQRVHGE